MIPAIAMGASCPEPRDRFAAVRRPLLVAAALASLSLGCTDGHLQQARTRDTAAGWRSYLATDPDPRDADLARERLEELVLAEVLRSHTIVGYKRFLEEFPNSEEAPGIQARLAGLRFMAAEAQDTRAAWRGFLKLHPHAPQRAQAEARLAALEGQTRPAGGTQLASAQRAATEGLVLTEAEDQALIDAATTARALWDYLDQQAAGRHRDTARTRLFLLELEGLLASDAVDQARAELARNPLAAQVNADGAMDRRIDRVEASLEAFSRQTTPPGAILARHWNRSVADLELSLGAPDPKDRWEAAEALGHVISVEAINPLLKALAPHQHPLVRQRAMDSLFRVLSLLPPEISEYEVSTRVRRLAPNAATAERSLVLALLLDAGGRLAEATVEYQRAFDAGLPDPLILRRWMTLRAERKEWYQAAISARQLALWALELARAETVEASEGVPVLAPARRLCAARELAMEADAVIREAGGQKTDFAEDLLQFEKTSTEALALSRARLADAELRLRAQSPAASLCERHMTRRLEQQDAQRRERFLRAYQESVGLRAALIFRAQRDPSPAIRELGASWAARSPGLRW